ncbi:PP2C family protein-serine/threonine phosphatase [Butyrivibrio fibrisolvens]|uniref:PP2C family protein-serine/threonine phosphatase n=1 Tax=Butyrivibrio fibrisolvens TaxID=831 RepID=UPI0018AD41DB|nr:PP2C family protein-serine/threonine phosphatase [Butyrivibrio fibrisolvens]
MKKRNKKIVKQALPWIACLFLITAIVNGICIYSSNSKNYVASTCRTMQAILVQVRNSLTEYKSLSWLLNYWQDHSDEMDLPGDRLNRSSQIQRLLLDHEYESLYSITPEQTESLSEEEQRIFAEECYLLLMPEFSSMKNSFNLTEITFEIVLDDTNIFPLFQGIQEGEKSFGGNFCALGEAWPFDINEQPGIREMYESKEDKAFFEEKSSLADAENREYLMGYLQVPVDGNLKCHLTAIQRITNIRKSIVDSARSIELINAVLLFICAVIILHMIYSKIIDPLTRIMSFLSDYAKTKNTKDIVQKLLTIEADNELGRLADDCSDMITGIERYSKEKQRMLIETERINTELELAARIQKDMIPGDFSAFNDRTDLDLYGSMTPAKSVGGDFYDFFFLDEDHMYIAIADVSGKGIPAAMFMMLTKNILANNAREGKSPAKILTDSNTAILMQNKELMFLTVWVAILEISTGKLTMANAGHERPALLKTGGEFELLNDKHGYVLGVRKGKQYTEEVIELEKGSKIFVYTDGVVEAIDSEKEQFGTDRMLQALNRVAKESPKQLLDEVRSSVDAFVEEEEQFDDLTMLCLEYK